MHGRPAWEGWKRDEEWRTTLLIHGRVGETFRNGIGVQGFDSTKQSQELVSDLALAHVDHRVHEPGQ